MRRGRSILAGFAIGLIRAYQCTLSGLIGAKCRFVPTCSQFAIEAICECGVLRGSWLALLRILRCHPWHKGGFDPVSAHIRPKTSSESDTTTHQAQRSQGGDE